MANNFVLNLRAVRSEANSKASNMANNTKMPITRGDIQKQRQAQSKVDPNAFINFLRMITISPEVKKEKEQININDAPAQNIDRMSPEQTERFREEEATKDSQAYNGTLFLDPKIKEQMSAENGTLFTDDMLRHYATQDMFDNYDRLNEILDDYDLAETWVGKYKVIENAIRSFGENIPPSVYDWLDEIGYQTSMGSLYGGRNPKDISDYMRQLNNTIKRIMSPKRI